MKKEKGYTICIIPKSGHKGISNTHLRTFFRQTFNCDWINIDSSGSTIIIKVSFKLNGKKVKRFATKLGDYGPITFNEGTFAFNV